MISGVTVTVNRRTASGTDRLGNATYTDLPPESVGNVLVAPVSTEDMEAARQAGYTLACTLHFPKSYTESLRGATVTLPAPYGGTYRVVGDPKPYMAENCPTPWNRPVNVEVAHG